METSNKRNFIIGIVTVLAIAIMVGIWVSSSANDDVAYVPTQQENNTTVAIEAEEMTTEEAEAIQQAEAEAALEAIQQAEAEAIQQAEAALEAIQQAEAEALLAEQAL